MVVYSSASKYLESATQACDKIAKIDAIISALEDTALKGAANDHIEEYWLDDGQSKIKTTYKGVDEIFKSINSFLKLKEYWVNKLNGRAFRMVGSKQLRRGY